MISHIVFVFPLFILNKQILVEIEQTINKKDEKNFDSNSQIFPEFEPKLEKFPIWFSLIFCKYEMTKLHNVYQWITRKQHNKTIQKFWWKTEWYASIMHMMHTILKSNQHECNRLLSLCCKNWHWYSSLNKQEKNSTKIYQIIYRNFWRKQVFRVKIRKIFFAVNMVVANVGLSVFLSSTKILIWNILKLYINTCYKSQELKNEKKYN